MSSLPFIYEICDWMLRLTMLVVVTRRRRHANAAMAWLLVIFLEPWLGTLLFFMIGNHRLPRSRVERTLRLMSKADWFLGRFRNHPRVVTPKITPHQAETVRLAQRLGKLPILGGNAFMLMSDTDDFIQTLVKDIDAAKNHVHLLFYIYGNDEVGHKVAEALHRAVLRGVVCRVMVDSVGSKAMLKSLAKEMKGNGVEVRALLPVNALRATVARVDLRNHRKIAVIDGRTGYTGSQNIVNADYGRGGITWDDLMVRLAGPVVLELQAVFAADWFFETDELLDTEACFPDPEPAGDISIQTVPSGPGFATENYQRLVVHALHSSRNKATITTPYLIPDEAFLEAMQIAVLRGVEVSLIVPEQSDQVIVGNAARAYYAELLDMGVQIYLYQDTLLHAKTMAVDNDLAFLGSSNFDIRSFELNFEINLILYGEAATGMLRNQQREYLKKSRPLLAEEWRKRSFFRQVFQNICRLFSPLL